MGKINKDLSLLKEWGVYKALHFKNSNYVIRMADLNTPFQKLVSSAQEATIQHRRISKKEIKKLLLMKGNYVLLFSSGENHLHLLKITTLSYFIKVSIFSLSLSIIGNGKLNSWYYGKQKSHGSGK